MPAIESNVWKVKRLVEIGLFTLALRILYYVACCDLKVSLTHTRYGT